MQLSLWVVPSDPHSPSTQCSRKRTPEPGTNYTPEYRQFFERLRRARIDKGLSIADMSDEVGLRFKLAYEFETLATPLPFEWIEIWCQVVDVPFDELWSMVFVALSIWLFPLRAQLDRQLDRRLQIGEKA